jgi:hypothetical protein
VAPRIAPLASRLDEEAILRLRRVLWTQTANAIRQAARSRREPDPEWLEKYRYFEIDPNLK